MFDLCSIRVEISFKSFEELRSILSFYQKHNIRKINIPCKNTLKKEFLLKSIKLSREEFPGIDLVPHFSILHEFKRNRLNTLNSVIEFIKFIKFFGCREFLLVSGSQRRSTLDSTSTLNFLCDKTFFSNNDFSIGVAFNPYLPGVLFEQEILKLKKKIKTGIVKSIWIQFGTDFLLLESRMKIIEEIIVAESNFNSQKKSKIMLFGSIFIPSKQFLSRFKYRPWKGVYCSNEFLNSIDIANNLVIKLLEVYKRYKISPLIETDTSSENKLKSLIGIL